MRTVVSRWKAFPLSLSICFSPGSPSGSGAEMRSQLNPPGATPRLIVASRRTGRSMWECVGGAVFYDKYTIKN